jgi:hypothetical protein
MNTDERRAVLKIHEKYPEYELAYVDFVDWFRKVGHKFGKPQDIADEFEKSEFFKREHK